jgi:hypothetical protein
LARQISKASFDAVDSTIRRQQRLVLGVIDAWTEALACPT